MKEERMQKLSLSRRQMLKMSAVLAAGTALVACEGQAVNPTTVDNGGEEAGSASEPQKATGSVVVMHLPNEFTEEHITAFETENPGIDIELVESDLTRFFAMFAAGTPPDLYRTQAPDIPQMLARNLLFDLTPFFEGSDLIDIDDLAPFNKYYQANDPLSIGSGKIYGMCKDASPDGTIWANTAHFEAAGLSEPDDTKAMTYAEVMEAAKATTIFDGDRLMQLGYGYEEGWADRFWMVMLAETGQTLYTDSFDRIVISENPDAMEMVKWFFDMAQEKITTSPQNPSPGGWFGEDFGAGIVAMAQYGFWFSPMAEGDGNKGHVKMLPAPTWTGKRNNPTITATGMIMTSATEVPEAAWKVFEYYNAGPPSEERAASGWGVPALKSQYAMIPQETAYQKQAFKVLQGELEIDSAPVQFNPFIGSDTVGSSWLKHLDLALSGDASFDEMVANIEEEVNLAISEGIDRING